jgi:putative transposase
MHDGAVGRRNCVRKPGHDYRGPGVYFVTVDTEAMQRLFGEVIDGNMFRSGAGDLVAERWREIPHRFPGVQADDFVVIPITCMAC